LHQKLLADMNLRRVTKLKLVGTSDSTKARLQEAKLKVCTNCTVLD
jgi:hypothetical protein